MRKINIDQSGTIFISILIIMPFFLVVATAYMQLAVNGFRVARSDQYKTASQFAADAGADYAMEEINQNTNWTGTTSEVEVHSDNDLRTTFEVSVIDGAGETKIINSVGKTYKASGSVEALSTIDIDVGVRGVTSGEFSVVSGVGGMIMRNNAKIVNGNVFVNGGLAMSNTSSIGLSILPVDVTVAHQACPSPPDGSYPQVCENGEDGEPITLNNSAHIFGDVIANNQTNGSGMSNGGLCSESNPTCSSEYPVSPQALPGYDRSLHKSSVIQTYSGNWSCSSGTTNWPDNYRITGNVTISGTCAVTMQGDVWIEGNFTMRNSGILKNGASGSEPSVIMVDGSSGFVMSNSASMLPNTSLTGHRVITYANSTGNPDTEPTGEDLYDSQSITTISLSNSATAAQTEFYARWSKIAVGNAGSIGAVVAQTVELTNNIAITLGTSVSGFGETIWVIDSYQRDIN